MFTLTLGQVNTSILLSIMIQVQTQTPSLAEASRRLTGIDYRFFLSQHPSTPTRQTPKPLHQPILSYLSLLPYNNTQLCQNASARPRPPPNRAPQTPLPVKRTSAPHASPPRKNLSSPPSASARASSAKSTVGVRKQLLPKRTPKRSSASKPNMRRSRAWTWRSLRTSICGGQ